jgi:hypothetical protein
MTIEDVAALDVIEEEIEQEEAWDQFCEWWAEFGEMVE